LTTFTLSSHPKTLKQIDYIYVINLDERPEKWRATVMELAPYGIVPERFSAVNGWKLSPQKIREMILKFLPEMKGVQ
jgi:GR25 family glycosyltransferase involved in LPS biosynthesis